MLVIRISPFQCFHVLPCHSLLTSNQQPTTTNQLGFPLSRHALPNEGRLSQFQIQEHAAQILFERGFFHIEFRGRLFEERTSQSRGVEIQRVDVHQVAARDQQVDFQSLTAELFLQAPHAPMPIVERVEELRFLFGRGRRRGSQRGRRSG